MQKMLALLATAMMMATPTLALASVSNDQVLSQHIKEPVAGSTDQNTNSGAGIKTGHIVNQAVSSEKIKDGAVTGIKLANGAVTGTNLADASVTPTKIADGAVTNSKISGIISGAKLGAHGHTGADVADGTVGTAKLADGAVTDAKISGVISGSKLGVHEHTATEIISGKIDAAFLPVGISANTVAAGDHTHPAQSAGYANVVIVEKGTDLGNVILNINDASMDNPYLVKVMPGTYGDILMRPYVDVEGAGVYTTTIGRVVGADNSELRNLSVKMTLDQDNSSASFQSPSRITNVNVSSTAVGSFYVYYAFEINRPAVLTNVNFDFVSSDLIAGIGISNNSDAVLNNVTVNGDSMYAAILNSKNLSMNGGKVLFTGVEYPYDGSAAILTSGTNAITEISNANLKSATTNGNHLIGGSFPTNATVFITNSKMEGVNLTGPSITIKCMNSYDNFFNARVCP